ncbi:MAG: PCRF domain-containing protein, partial [Deltaproteobacteria bacterium]
MSSANSYPPGAARRCNTVSRSAHCVRPQGRLGSGARVDDKLQEIEHKFDRLTADLGDPEVLADPARIKTLMKERSQLEPLVEAFRDFKRVRDELRQHEALLEDADADMRQMARDELPQLKGRLADLEGKLKILLL